MSPRSLLFCSNRETSQLLARFLHELHYEVEYCPEIFEAVKRLTARPHELVIIDWDEGLEASFLLKTVRELKSHRAAFVLALAKPEAVAAVRQAGANEVVTKSQASEEIKNSWISSRDFLAGLERNFSAPKPAIAPEPIHRKAVVHHAPGYVPPRPPEEIVPLPLAASPIEPVVRQPEYVPQVPTFATFENDAFSGEGLFRGMLAGFDRLRLPQFGHRGSVFLGRVATVVAFFTVGYVASQPLSKAGSSIAEIYQATVGIQPRERYTSHAEPRPQPAAVQASLKEPEPPSPRVTRDDSQMKVEVTPLAYRDAHREAPLKSAPQLVDTSAASDSTSYPEVPESQNHTPESLASQFPGGAVIRNAAEKIGPSILGALEPVNLPGYLADKLLVDRVDPSYPAQALRAGLQGPVVLQAWIGKDGKIRNLKLVRGPLLLGEAAYEAVKQWRYQPYLLNGEAVEAQTYVTVDFKLP